MSVRAIITGGNLPLTGEEIRDRYPIAQDKVRYHGEVVALVVADTMKQAEIAADNIQVIYEPLAVVNSPTEALNPNSPLLHPDLDTYKKISEVFPEVRAQI